MTDASSRTLSLEITPTLHSLTRLFPTETPLRTPSGGVCFLLIMQGSALVEIDGQMHTLHEGTLVYLLPGHLLLLRLESDDFLCRFLFFSFDYLSDFPLLLKADLSDYAGNHPCRHLLAEEFQLMNHYFDFLADRHAAYGEQNHVTKGILFSLVLEVAHIYVGQPVSSRASRSDELVDGFFALLHAHYKSEHSATFYADRLCVSDKHLMRTIKQKTGQTFHYWLSDFVVREAKLLLRSTDKTITEIADELHFPNSSFFARFFRQHTGMSPGGFRRER